MYSVNGVRLNRLCDLLLSEKNVAVWIGVDLFPLAATNMQE